MITKTEIDAAILRCEPRIGWGPLDRSTVLVERGDLAVLIEAAKRVEYVNMHNGYMPEANSSSELVIKKRDN